jgi:aldose 1-epimerase
VVTKDGPALELAYLSKDGEEGYPGNLAAKVIYTLTNQNELKIDYSAQTDKDTVVNLTHHSYFNLAGAGTRDILDHVMMLNANRFTPVDSDLIPNGELRGVKGTPMDFTTPMTIGARINQDDEQIKFGKGYDHNWVLNSGGGKLALAARVTEPATGRVMEAYTTQPGVQFYTGNFLDGKNTGKGGKVYRHRYGFCLETQHFPDSPNHPAFPSTVLKPGETYRQTTVYRFAAK